MVSRTIADISELTDLDSSLSFPDSMVSHKVDNHRLYVFPEKAIWFVASDEAETIVLSKLVDGLTPRQILNELQSKDLGDNEPIQLLHRILIKVPDGCLGPAPIETKLPHYNELRISVTSGCNLRCIHCYRSAEEPNPCELKMEEWCHVVDQHAALGGHRVLVTGGEPLTRLSTVEAILKHCRDCGLETSFFTNGVLLDQGAANILFPYTDKLQISLDGPDRITADSVRGRGNFQAVMRALELVVDHGVHASLVMVPLPETIDIFEKSLPAFAENLLKGFGDLINVRLSRVVEDGRLIKHLNEVPALEFEERVRALEERIYGKGFCAETDAMVYGDGYRVTSCGYGGCLAIEPDGEVYPCEIEQINSVGNVRNTPLVKLRDRLASLSSTVTVDDIAPCRECDIRYICGGPCRLRCRKFDGGLLQYDCSQEKHLTILRRLIEVSSLPEANYD